MVCLDTRPVMMRSGRDGPGLWKEPQQDSASLQVQAAALLEVVQLATKLDPIADTYFTFHLTPTEQH